MCPPDKLSLHHHPHENNHHEQYHHRNESDNTLLDSDATQKLVHDVEPTVAEVLTSAPPPWHSVAVIGLISAVFVQILPSWEQLDEIATLQTLARAEPWIDSVWNLGVYRLVVATMIGSTTLHVLCGPGWTQITNWKPQSKLKRNATITLKGIKTLFPFTSWSWNLLGFSYSLNALVALCVATGHDAWIVALPHNWLLRLAVIFWEMAAPCAILVSTVIRYAIWEMALRGGTGDTSNLRSFRNVMMHNANSVFVLVEAALLGGLPVRFSEIALAPLFGVCYVLFAWSMTHQWTDPQHGPMFLYYFLDTTLGKVTSISLVALLCSLLFFYVLFATARIGLDQLSLYYYVAMEQQQHDHHDTNNDPVFFAPILLAANVSFVIAISSLVCRFRD